MRSLHEVQCVDRREDVALRPGASTAVGTSESIILLPTIESAASCAPTKRLRRAAQTRAPLRQQGCSPLESHRGLKHEGIL